MRTEAAAATQAASNSEGARPNPALSDMRGGVCANAKEDSEAEGNLAREPAKNVPAHTGRDPDESYENETNNIGARMREGKGSHEEKQEDEPCL